MGRKALTASAYIALVVTLVGCERPTGVPSNASSSYDWYNNHFTYEWRSRSQAGCASWMATASYAVVELSVDPTDCENGPGLSYFTVLDFLVFQGYWPWPINQPTVTLDSNGMINGVLPCPHSLTTEQIAEIRAVVREVSDQATTDGERRTLMRVDELLSQTNGEALSSHQTGCTDMPVDVYPWPARTEDTWSERPES
jgi:hypothetical protein